MAALIRRCANWAEFTAEIRPLDTKSKGDAFERLVQLYLTLDPQYATKLRRVWLYKEVPAPIRQRLRLPSRDKGIDLIAETKDGGYWAVQAKYRAEAGRSLTLRELSTFGALAYVSCRGIDYALVCTTTDRIARELEGLPRRVGFRTSEVWEGLGEEFFARARAALAHRTPRLNPTKPRPHQRRAIRNALRHYRDARETRGKLIHPCGTGKTLTAYWIAKDLGARTILVAVPSLALIRQTLEVWLRESVANGREIAWLCVCSDETAGTVDRDELTAHTYELGVPCVTDPKTIAEWLRDHRRGTRIVFATYQSGKALAAGARRARVTFDLGIMDEAHRTVGGKAKVFAHLLHDKNIPIRSRLFMTATERRYKGSSDQILSMEDEAVYGETVDLLTFKKAIAARPPILSDYEVLVLGVGRKQIGELIRQNAFVRPNRGGWRELEAETLAGVVALRKAMKRHGIRHTVSFHSSIRRAVEFKEHQDTFTRALSAYGKLSTFHVSAKIRTSERARELQAFDASRRGLVTNARCLTEGVDLPDIDGVVFADPKRSTIDIVQATGRALRLAKGKHKGYVVVPLLIDERHSVEQILESSDFRDVLVILRALASNDDRIIEQFRSISSKQRPARRMVRIDAAEIAALPLNLEEFAGAIQLRAWSKLARLSWRPFEEAREFVRGLRLRSETEWRYWCGGELRGKPRRPPDIPTAPGDVYAEQGWESWSDWLGTGRAANVQWREFTAARRFTRGLRLRNQAEWHQWCRGELRGKPKRPVEIPATPYTVYADRGWESWGDWLGSRRFRNVEWREFAAARRFVRGLRLPNGAAWRRWCKGELRGKPRRPQDIPAAPGRVYADQGWDGMGDWLGTGTRIGGWREFTAARRFVRGLGLRRQVEWFQWCRGELRGKPKRPSDIPTNSKSVYAHQGWIGMADWLGAGKRIGGWREFTAARRFVRGLNLQSSSEWERWCGAGLPGKPKRPSDIPTNVRSVYADQGWIGMGDWLGTERVKNIEWREFAAARRFARGLGLRRQVEWIQWCHGELRGKPKRPSDIPITPQSVYDDQGWKNWWDWLGTGRRWGAGWRPFPAARRFARGLGLRSSTEWFRWCQGQLRGKPKRPAGIPTNPSGVYADQGWRGFGDWLGTGNVRIVEWRSFPGARRFARGLRLRNNIEWVRWCKGELPGKPKRPADIPSNPNAVYADQGWQGLGDWLGTGRR